jgi:2-methylcitrate dehydratase PrpD
VRTLTKAAAFVQSDDLAHMPGERLDRVKRHVLDTWGAQAAGSQTDDGIAIGRLLAPMDGPMSSIVAVCARARCTEVDDIHLTSCTTPGSVVVSTALTLASARAAAGEPTKVRDFCAAVLAGYESMIRLAVAIDGPVALHRGVWPTAFAAAFGSAATAGRLLGLNIQQTASALATSLAFAQHRAVASSPARSLRWLSLGVAAASGVMAARGARAGLVGTIDADAWLNRLTRGLGRQYLFDEIGMKPYPTARQALAAIEAAREIASAEQLGPPDIDSLVVGLPERQRAIVGRRGFPDSRIDSIVNVRYQIALAIAEPERLREVRRTPPFDEPGVRRLMTRIRVQRARDLDGHYPRCWPARVEIRARGRRHTRVVLHPLGDARHPLGWNDVAEKLRAIAGPIAGGPTVERLVSEWRAADIDAPMPAFP